MSSPARPIARNQKARYDYEILSTLEAGIILTGSEVKAIRSGQVNIKESYAGSKEGELYLFNLHISNYENIAKHIAFEPRRPRKLLLHRRERNRLIGAVQRKGQTLLPLSLYFNTRGLAKLELALARGKKLHDKRETIKERDWQRRKKIDLT